MSLFLLDCDPCDGRDNESNNTMRMHKEVADQI